MGKIYGERWEITSNPALGEGGQSHVFPVVDLRSEFSGELALKRVKNSARLDRFRNEIEAIKRLNHPNIIKLIDHSALDAAAGEEKQFLVTPIAKGGDLSKPDRLSLYEGSIEAVLQVALQIASGLKAAHAAGIIHRDIKPQNILFVGAGHELWISDFGICLIREQPRSTEAGEIVGPRSFMAPELEAGGQLHISPAADVYSLGKVIYYMISGGVIVPREQLHEETYSHIFKTGERLRLLELLLARMICTLDHRLQNIDAVIEQLEKISAWEKNARLLPLSASGLANVEKLQKQAQTFRRVETENSAAREQESRMLVNVKETFEAWVGAELKKAAAHISGGGDLTCEVGEVTLVNNHDWLAQYDHGRAYKPVGGFELRFDEVEGPFPRRHTLQLRLCQNFEIKIKTSHSNAIPAHDQARDLQFAMIPYYRQALINKQQNQSAIMGYLTARNSVGVTRGQFVRDARGGQRTAAVKLEAVTQSFKTGGISQCTNFRASEWPGCTENLHVALTEAIETFVAYIAAGARSVGL